MGAIADAIAAYTQPLLEQTAGDLSAMNNALAIAQMCWNLALTPEDRRDAFLKEIQPALEMTDEEFAEFRQHVVLPMIRRHGEMFPGLHKRFRPGGLPSAEPASDYEVLFQRQPLPGPADAPASPAQNYPAARRNGPCPRGSGRKYKHCCGAPQIRH